MEKKRQKTTVHLAGIFPNRRVDEEEPESWYIVQSLGLLSHLPSAILSRLVNHDEEQLLVSPPPGSPRPNVDPLHLLFERGQSAATSTPHVPVPFVPVVVVIIHTPSPHQATTM